MDQQPSCSFSDQNDIEELKTIGVNVWGQQQHVLEEQALNELTTYNNNLREDIQQETRLEDTNISSKTTESHSTLDINSYLKTQEDLKKRQDHKKSLLLADKSKLLADQINNKQNKSKALIKSKKQENLRVTRKRQAKEEIAGNIQEKSDNCVKNEVSETNSDQGSEYIPSDVDSDFDPDDNKKSTRPTKKLKLCTINHSEKYEKVIDDGNIKCYEERLNKHYEQLEILNKEAIDNGTELPEDEICIGQLKSSTKIWNSLYDYQQEGVKWLWGLHQKGTGGLLGDEMGLGKTVQIIAFLYSLNYTAPISSYAGFKGLGPTLIVCPSTVIHQWVKHFHDWAPEFRVSILHQSGSYTGNKRSLIKENIQAKGILITTYQSMLKYKSILTEQLWHYVILDEGHKIRNPGAQISEAVKLFKTPHRLLLTGSPMQNNLQELWSLFDFVHPGMLGTLQVFMEHFAAPIMHGGYANASPMQEALALSMAKALKDMITPHLLRRAKNDVKDDIRLPCKSEQVLFCSITPEQRELYRGYLLSDHVSNILGRGNKNWFSENHTRANVLMSITTLRKICNHPDIYLNDANDSQDADESDDKSGYYKRSGKMVVVSALLKMWKKQKHRVLLFTQSRAMVAMFEKFLKANDYKYLKMYGGTSVASRQPLIDKYNNDKSIDVFVLTTRVGGLGINLTGADRVIIYDPDWNPATDTQARERAWRIGQDKEVTIYRLISAGTIEEKMYQRQIWKQLLSNKVLLDPKTQRFFKSSDLHDLFSLQEEVDTNPETTNIFKNSRISMEEKLKEKKEKRKRKEKSEETQDVKFTVDKIEKMKEMAAQIAKNFSKTTSSKAETLDLMQKDLLEERQTKLDERAQLKKLTPMELLQYNREKNLLDEEPTNRLDDCDTDVNFTKALIISEKAADLYKAAKNSSKQIDAVTEEYKSLTSSFAKPKKKNKLDKLVDNDYTGNVEGEIIEGVVKRQNKKLEKELRKSKKQEHLMNEQQDDYVLSKLFSRKGVQSALQHDNIVTCTSTESSSIRIHSETQERTDLALQALRKSRLNKWRC